MPTVFPRRRPTRRRLLASLAAAALPVPCRALSGPRRWRIAHVMSFSSPWRWTDGQWRGFQEGLGAADIESHVFAMDARRHVTPAALAERGRLARAFVEAVQPDLLYLTDDDAQTHVARHYAGTRLPVVFSGMNDVPARHGLADAPNVTGVLEREHAVETLRLLQALVPGVRRLLVLSGPGPYWDAVVARVTAQLRQFEGLQSVTTTRTDTFEAYRHAVQNAPAHADALLHLGILNLPGPAGETVPYSTVQRWVVENSPMPDASFWIDRVHHGTLASVTVSELEQGREAGRLARAILHEGRPPDTLPIRATTKGTPALNLTRARALGLTVQSTPLLQSEVIQGYEWQR